MSVCTRVFSVDFGPGLDSMSPARSCHSASHAAGSHDWLPKKTGGPGLRRGRIRWIQFAQSLLTVAHQPRASCIRLVHNNNIIIVSLNPCFHCSTHHFAVSLNFRRSSKVQGCVMGGGALQHVCCSHLHLCVL